MLLATTTLAARIERAECRTVVDFAEQGRRRGRPTIIEPIAGGVAVCGGPGQPYYKLAGVGFGGPVDERDLARVEAAHDAIGADIRVELATLADASIAPALTRRGYALIGYENVLGLALTADAVRELERVITAARDITIVRAQIQDLPAWRDTIIDGFMHPDAFDGPPPTECFDRETLRGVFEDPTLMPAIVAYLAWRGSEIAGAGAVRISEGLAQMAGASTLPSHRRRGVQSALLRVRLVEAARAGCDLAITCTEPASKSQENMQRAGFELLYSRAVLVRTAGKE